jgi:predicted dehydrogenase
MSESKLPKEERSQSKVTRRRFLGTTAAAGAVLSAPTIIPSTALGLGGAVPPSERIVVGGIGIGGRARYVLRYLLPHKDVQFVEVCDVQKTRREEAKKQIDEHYGNTDCKVCGDMNEFLERRTDIDAILTATGDRWHAHAAIRAMRAGKDVYSEKPSCMFIREGQQVVDTQNRYGRVYQTGTQRLSEPNFVFVDEVARSGRIGRIHTVRAHTAPWVGVIMRQDWLEEEPLPPKEEVDWDAWLGPCPWRPFNTKYIEGGWRGFYDFHTSDIGEWGAHTIAQCQSGIGASDTSPVSYFPVQDPSADGMVTEFANGIKMTLNLDKDKKIWHGSCGVRYEGDEGWVAVADGYAQPEASSEALLKDFDKIVNEYRERTGRPVGSPDVPNSDFAMTHVRDFLDCVKSRRQTVANAEVMHRSMTAVHAANIAMWLQRDLTYDPVAQEFLGDAEANRMLSRAQREPWIY